MRLPKTVVLAGKKYKVILDPMSEDGECDLEKLTVTIGTKNVGDVLETFLHECLEAIFVARGNCYTVYNEGNDKLKIVLDHAEFENAMKDLALAIEGIIKK